MGCRLLVLAALVLVVATALAPGAAAKGKKASCKGTKVAVKAGKKTTCLPFAKVFPPPKELDTRLVHLQQVLKFDPASAVTGKKRKRVRKLQSSFRTAAQRAQTKLLKVAPKALAFVDRQGRRRRSVLIPAGPGARLGRLPVPGRPGPAAASKAPRWARWATTAASWKSRSAAACTRGSPSSPAVASPPSTSPSARRRTARSTAKAVASSASPSKSAVRARSSREAPPTSNRKRRSTARSGRTPSSSRSTSSTPRKSSSSPPPQGYPIVIRGGVTRKVHIPMPSGPIRPGQRQRSLLRRPARSEVRRGVLREHGQIRDRQLQERRGALEQLRTPALLRRTGLRSRQQRDQIEKGRRKNSSASTPRRGRTAAGRPKRGGHSSAPLNAEFSPMASQDASPTIQYTVDQIPGRRSGQGHGESHLDRRGRPKDLDRSRSSRPGIEIEGNFGGELPRRNRARSPERSEMDRGGETQPPRARGRRRAQRPLHRRPGPGMCRSTSRGSSNPASPGATSRARHRDRCRAGSMTVTGTGPEHGPPYEYDIESLDAVHADTGARGWRPARKPPRKKATKGSTFETGPPGSSASAARCPATGSPSPAPKTKASARVTYIQNWDLHATE